MAEPGSIVVQVFWQPPDAAAVLRAVHVRAGATLGDAVRASGVDALLPATWDSGALQLAVAGRPRAPDTPAVDGDRIDLLRPLRIDPREARRRRALRRSTAGGG